ncbi:hypothetical protein ABZW10_13405 [Kitasatospora sp. NPDC004723]|uniref:hypothetical protein n=1 Tax=Kitasatospora sp. NPDC004723 TaxID=3154288 RepID=UPI0033B7C5BC
MGEVERVGSGGGGFFEDSVLSEPVQADGEPIDQPVEPEIADGRLGGGRVAADQEAIRGFASNTPAACS